VVGRDDVSMEAVVAEFHAFVDGVNNDRRDFRAAKPGGAGRAVKAEGYEQSLARWVDVRKSAPVCLHVGLVRRRGENSQENCGPWRRDESRRGTPWACATARCIG
jgi:hypothetical protein